MGEKESIDRFVPNIDAPEPESEALRDIHRFIRENGMDADAVDRAMFLAIDRGRPDQEGGDPVTYGESEYRLARLMEEAEEGQGVPLNEITRVLYDRQRAEARPLQFLRFVERLPVSERGKSALKGILERNRSGNVVFSDPASGETLLTVIVPKELETFDRQTRAGWLLFSFEKITEALTQNGVGFDIIFES